MAIDDGPGRAVCTPMIASGRSMRPGMPRRWSPSTPRYGSNIVMAPGCGWRPGDRDPKMRRAHRVLPRRMHDVTREKTPNGGSVKRKSRYRGYRRAHPRRDLPRSAGRQHGVGLSQPPDLRRSPVSPTRSSGWRMPSCGPPMDRSKRDAAGRATRSRRPGDAWSASTACIPRRAQRSGCTTRSTFPPR